MSIFDYYDDPFGGKKIDCVVLTGISEEKLLELEKQYVFDYDYKEHERSRYQSFTEKRKQIIDNVQTKKSEHQDRRIPKLIHGIADKLLHRHVLIAFCVNSETQTYKITKGKQYEILGIDYRLDDNYIMMRELNENTEPLFGGDLKKVNDFKIPCKNYFEFVRRGYYNCAEMFLKEKQKEEEMRIAELKRVAKEKEEMKLKEEEKKKNSLCYFIKTLFVKEKKEETKEKEEIIVKKTTEELEKEIKEGLIEIPVSKYYCYFNNPIQTKTDEEFKKRFKTYSETFTLSGKYTLIHMSWKGILNVKVNNISKIPMTVMMFDTIGMTTVFKKTINNDFSKPVERELMTYCSQPAYLNVIIELSPKYQYKQANIKIEIENDQYFSFQNVYYYEKHLPDNINFNYESKGKCLLCNDDFGEKEVIFDDIDNNLFHHSCIIYANCCCCQYKIRRSNLVYKPELKGFVCSECFPNMFK